MIEQSVSLASNGVVKVPGYEQLVRFGYTKNRDVYRLRVDATGEWEGLTVRAFWHVPDGKDPASSLVVDGYVAVPASVTAQSGSGCITFEGTDGTKTVTSADLHYRVSANSGTEDGTEPEPGTPAWQQLVDAVHTDATAAEQAKTDAQTAASEAATSAGNADQSAKQAADSLQELKDGIASGDFKGEPGNDGKSPVVTVAAIENGHRVSITDKDGTKTIDVLNGQTGKTGATPALTIGTVSSGDKPSANITGTPENPVLNLMLQPGPQGPAVALDTTLAHEGEAADAKATGDAISAVKARQNILIGTETGNPIAVDDAFSAPLCGLSVYGKSTQDGTPTPDAPVPIVSAGDGGSVAVKVTGKNLLNPCVDAHVTVTSEGLILDGTIPQHIIITIPLLAGTYTFGDFTQKPFVHSYINKQDRNIKDVRTIVITATDQVMLYIAKGTYSKELVKPYIVPGEAAPQSYEPYREQLLTLPTPTGLPGIPVTSCGNYTDPQGKQWICDEVDLEKGVRRQRCQRFFDIDNHAVSIYQKADSVRFMFETDDVWDNGIYKNRVLSVICNNLKYSSSLDTTNSASLRTTGDSGWKGKSKLYIVVPSNIATIDELKSYLGDDFVVIYPLATPIETPLTPAELAAYKALTAYGPDTVVQAGDGAGVKLEYQRDVNLVIKKLEDAIASMT